MKTKWFLETDCRGRKYVCPVVGRHNNPPWLYKNNHGPLPEKHPEKHPYREITIEELALLVLTWNGTEPFRVWTGNDWEEVLPTEL